MKNVLFGAERYRLEMEWYQRTMREGRKGNGGPVAQPKAEPYYRRFEKRRQTGQTDNHAGN